MSDIPHLSVSNSEVESRKPANAKRDPHTVTIPGDVQDQILQIGSKVPSENLKMKSKRSVVRAILFVLRLQKSVTAHRQESRRQATIHEGRQRLVRCESSRQRRRSSSKPISRKRNSAPSSSYPLRSPSLLRALARPNHNRELDFGIFTGMSQPYSLGLDESRGRPLLSVCAGAAHALASTALLVRQQSLDEHTTRSFDSATASSSARSRRVFRQGSVETLEKKRKSEENENRKKIKNNMITHIGALLAVEQDDVSALKIVLGKNTFDVDSTLTNCLYGNYRVKWTLLDVALMLGNRSCAQLLIDHGAQENLLMNTLQKRNDALREALESTSKKLAELKQGPLGKDSEKLARQLGAHLEILYKMRTVLQQPRVPESPVNCRVEVTGPTEVTVHFSPSATKDQPTIVKYKVEWCSSPLFDEHIHSWEEMNMSKLPVRIGQLDKGSTLSYRVSAASIHGYSETTVANPLRIKVSSWEDVDGKREGRHEQIAGIRNLADQIDRHRQSLVWQRVFPSHENSQKKKKTGLKELFTASSKFSRNLQRGCYLATIIYTEGKVLCTVDDCLPIIEVDEAVTSLNKEDYHWLMKLSLCWDQLSVLLDYNPNAYANNIALSFRSKIIAAAQSMHNALGLKDIGRLYQQPIIHDNVVFLVTVRFVSNPQSVQALTLRWMSFDKLMRKKTSCQALEVLNKETVTVMNFFESCQIPLKRGLYLCYLKLHSSLQTIRVVVPDNLPSVLPFVCVRENPHITEEEWRWIKAVDENENIRPTESQLKIHSQISNAISVLLHDLDVDADLVPGHRLFRTEVLQPHNDVSIVLILPKAEDVCSAPTGNTVYSVFEQRRGCSSLAIPVFEMVHLCTYQPDFISTYCRLSIFLEHFMMISQYEQRKCLLENDAKVYRRQHEILADFQSQLDEIWKRARWISRIASAARDKNASSCAVPLCRLLAPLQRHSPEEFSDVGYHSDQSCERSDLPMRQNRPHSVMGSPLIDSFNKVDNRFILRRRKSVDDDTLKPDRENEQTTAKSSNVISVFAAYDCGLAKGTSVKLSIAGNTTSQEVVSLVVEQLAKVSSRVHRDEIKVPDPDEYCLAAVIGARERRLKDDFAILNLQNPWSKGKLFVRRRDCVLAALQFGNEAVV